MALKTLLELRAKVSQVVPRRLQTYLVNLNGFFPFYLPNGQSYVRVHVLIKTYVKRNVGVILDVVFYVLGNLKGFVKLRPCFYSTPFA